MIRCAYIDYKIINVVECCAYGIRTYGVTKLHVICDSKTLTHHCDAYLNIDLESR